MAGERRPGNMVIFRPYITLKDGSRIYARDYGYRAFPIEIDDEDNLDKEKENNDNEE